MDDSSGGRIHLLQVFGRYYLGTIQKKTPVPFLFKLPRYVFNSATLNYQKSLESSKWCLESVCTDRSSGGFFSGDYLKGRVLF